MSAERDLRERLLRAELNGKAPAGPERELREKLLRVELEKLQETLERIQSIDATLYDWAKETAASAARAGASVMRHFTGNLTPQEVANYVRGHVSNCTVSITHDDDIQVVRNGITVDVNCKAKPWKITVGGQAFKVDSVDELVRDINSMTKPAITQASFGEVLKHSSAILKAKHAPPPLTQAEFRLRLAHVESF